LSQQILRLDNEFSISKQFQNIAFSIEAIFTLIGEINRHNYRDTNNDNPYWMVETHHSQKCMGWNR